MTIRKTLAALLLLAPVVGPVLADDKPKAADKDKPASTAEAPADKGADLRGYKTVAEAIKADPKTFKTMAAAKPTSPGFIGIEVVDKGGKATVDEVVEGSPAEKAGVKAGDVLGKVGEDAVTPGTAKDRLHALVADEKATLTLARDGKAVKVDVVPRATSKPVVPGSAGAAAGQRALLGVTSEDPRKEGGVVLSAITEGGAAEKAGLKTGDVLLSVDETKIDEQNGLRDVLGKKKPGDVVKLAVKRGDKDVEVRATLQAEAQGFRPGGGGANGGWDDRLPGAWKKAGYRLAVIGIDYPDQKHNEKVTDKDWEKSLFSIGEYAGKSATGQAVYGSMNDYYKEISYGAFKVEGKFAGWVEVGKKRMEYSSGSGSSNREKTVLLGEAMDKLLEKDKDALKDVDGVFFLFAGPRVQTTRGSLYWPHRSSFRHGTKSWPYFIVQEGGDRMTDISVFCHEFGHMLGLPDLYARPEVPGMEGVGSWCAMSQQNPNGQPQHFSAWSKEQLGWIKPTVVDPRVKQKLVLSPIEDSNTECVKVPVKADGSEYLLLENRRKKGFDKELPAEGLLVWRVLPGNQTQKVFLEESHGIEGPSGPRSALASVPYPSPSNDSFTPFTTPSSKAQTGGGFDVYITNIRRLPDGRVSFQIGYEFQ